MPSNVVNEIVFRNVTAERQRQILEVCCNEKLEVDFEKLLPPPLNIWMGGVSQKHQVFPDNMLDWSTKNWSTKWNAYGHRPMITTRDTLILCFDTAGKPPYGWLVAVFNKLKISFEHNWLSEGGSQGYCGIFNYLEMETFVGDPWKETVAGGDMQKHLHMLRWGCEEFPVEKEDEVAAI